jgi:hypothetical protein
MLSLEKILKELKSDKEEFSIKFCNVIKTDSEDFIGKLKLFAVLYIPFIGKALLIVFGSIFNKL